IANECFELARQHNRRELSPKRSSAEALSGVSATSLGVSQFPGPKSEETSMATFVVIGYENELKAEEVRLTLVKMEKKYLIDLAGAVVVVRDERGRIKLHQFHNLTLTGALTGGFWGALIGLIFLNPLFGMAIGAAAGAISGALTDVGIDDNFMKNMGETLKPDTAALCVLIRQMTPDKGVAELQKFGGTLIKANLSHEKDARLREALATVQKSAGAAV